MKTLFTTVLLTAAALFGSSIEANEPKWGYAYINESQILPSSQAIDWAGTNNGIQGIFSEGIYVNPADTTSIVISQPGIYLVTYSTTLEVSQAVGQDGDAQFALYLNTKLVPGSIYGVGNAFSSDFISDIFNGALDFIGEFPPVYDAQTQCNGQVILEVYDYSSTLSLENQCENTLLLDNDAGTDDPAAWENNVSASIIIEKIDKIHEHHH